MDPYRYTGIHMDGALVWRVHLEDDCSQMQQSWYFIRGLKGVSGAGPCRVEVF